MIKSPGLNDMPLHFNGQKHYFSVKLLLVGILCIAIVNISWCFPLYFGDKALATKDIILSYQPMHSSLARQENSSFQTWEARGGFGFPLLAESQASQFYPLSLLARSILPAETGLFLLLALHLFLAGVFTLILTREIGLRVLSGLFSSISWMGSSFLVTQINVPPLLYQAVWLPLLFCCLIRYNRNKSPLAIISAGIILGCQLLAGHFQVSFYSLFFIAFYFFFFSKPFSFQKMITSRLLLFCTILLLGTTLAWGQLEATFDFWLLSNRSQGIDGDWLSWNPFQFFAMIQPTFFGTDTAPILIGNTPNHLRNYWGTGLSWVTGCYVGFLPFLMALFALFFEKSRIGFFLKCMLLLSLFFAAGKFIPVNDWLKNIPLWDSFRFPARWLFLSTFCLSLLAGFGLEKVRNSSALRSKQIGIVLVIFLFFYIAVLLLLNYLLYFQTEFLLSLAKRDDMFTLLQHARESLFLFNINNLLPLFLGFILVKIFYGCWKYRPISVFAVCCLLFLTSLDLGLHFRNKHHLVSTEFYKNVPKTKNLLEEISPKLRYLSIARYHADPLDHQLDLLPPSLNFPTQLETVDYRGSLYFLRFKRYFSSLYQGFVDSNDTIVENPSSERFLQLASVDAILRREEANSDFLSFYSKLGPTKLYLVNEPLKRVRLGYDYRIAANGDEAWRYINADDFDPQTNIIIESDIEPQLSAQNSSDYLKIIKESAEYHQYDVSCTTHCLLVINNSWSEHWQAQMDNQKVELLRANYLFQAIEVKPGKHTISLSYQEPSLSHWPYALGVACSLSLLLFIFGRKKNAFAMNFDTQAG